MLSEIDSLTFINAMHSNHRLNEALVKNARHLSVKKSVVHRFFTVNDVYSNVSRQVNDATEHIALLSSATRPCPHWKIVVSCFCRVQSIFQYSDKRAFQGKIENYSEYIVQDSRVKRFVDESWRNWCMPRHSERRAISWRFGLNICLIFWFIRTHFLISFISLRLLWK